MATITLVRHAESLWNGERRIQGHRDPPLSPRGWRQADLVASHLRSRVRAPVAAVYSSPLRRAVETARRIADACHAPIVQDPDLREVSLGQWEGMTVAEILAASPGAYERWLENPLTFSAPGGEDLRSFARRTLGAFERMQRDCPDANLLLVSHGGVIRLLLCSVLGLDLRFLFRLKQDNGAVSQVKINGDVRRVLLMNDTCHLRQAGAALTPRDVLGDEQAATDAAL